MGMQNGLIATAAGLVFTTVSVWTTSGELSVALDQQGQPSKQPSPKNPTPRPSDPTPDPKNPTPKPDSQRPPTDQPPRPGEREDGDRITDRDRDGDKNNDGRRDALDDDKTNDRQRQRNARAFAFQSPDVEGRFNIASRRLVQMEQRMQRSQEDLLKRLGEARQLSGERQANALFDVIQQMMKDQADLQRYLVQSRLIWTGDVDLGDETLPDDGEARVPDDEPRDR